GNPPVGPAAQEDDPVKIKLGNLKQRPDIVLKELVPAVGEEVNLPVNITSLVCPHAGNQCGSKSHTGKTVGHCQALVFSFRRQKKYTGIILISHLCQFATGIAGYD